MGSSTLGGDGTTIFYSPRSPGFSDDLTSRVTAARVRAFRLDPDSVTEVSVPSSPAPATSLGRQRRGANEKHQKIAVRLWTLPTPATSLSCAATAQTSAA